MKLKDTATYCVQEIYNFYCAWSCYHQQTISSIALKNEFKNSNRRDEFTKLSEKFIMVNTEDDEEPADEKYALDGRYVPRLFFLGWLSYTVFFSFMQNMEVADSDSANNENP